MSLTFRFEQWKESSMVGDKYLISSNGRIKSLYSQKILKPVKRKDGYSVYSIWNNGIQKTFLAHRIICDAFIGKIQPTKEVNHKNGDKSDNRIDNLEYVTHSENSLHMTNVLKKNKKMKFTDNQIIKIRELFSLGQSYKKIMNMFNISQSYFRYIVKNKNRAFIVSYVISMFIFLPYLRADIVSLDSDYVEGQAITSSKLNSDRHALTDGVNNIRGVFTGSVQSSGQIKADTIGEENMADDANPRVRTAEGAGCTDLVASGFLPTTSSSLILTVPVGIAYPDGYRIEKTSTTSATLSASKWTYYYLLTSGSFSTQEVAIDAATPTQPANSAILFRASSDATTINTITDFRKTSCATGPFSSIYDTAQEASLKDVLANGQPVRRFSPAGRTPNGYALGAFVSWDTNTTFKVTPGSLYINGKFRSVSTDTTVTQIADAPTAGGSGFDGTQAASSTHCVYAIADRDSVATYSVTYSTNCSTAPAGVTNYRLIGSIKTDASSLFVSRDVVTAHAISEYELPGGYIAFNGESASLTSADAVNVSGIADNGTGLYTISWDSDFNNARYSCFSTSEFDDDSSGVGVGTCNDLAAGSVKIETYSSAAGSAIDIGYVAAIAYGDTRK